MTDKSHNSDGPADVAATKLHPPKTLLAWISVALVLDFLFSLAAFAPPARVLGLVMVGLSLGLFGWALQTFKRVGTDVKTTTPADNLAIVGPYAMTRNPIYLAMLMLGCGLGLGLSNLWLLIGAPIFFVLITKFVIEPEEAYMARAFGEQYMSYKRTVRRWI